MEVVKNYQGNNKITQFVDRGFSFEDIALKTIHVMPDLLFQKPNKNSKAKNHVVALERRLELWEHGNIIKLLNEGESIQERLPTGEGSKDIAKISVRFKEPM